MISYLKGNLVSILEDKVILEVGGIGYGVFIPANLMSSLPSVGKELKLHTYLNVREDAMQLFGFTSVDDLEVYKLVLGVNGIGPKGGLSILSQLSPNELRFAVASSDVKAISKANGIGKKTAEKLIIELKDKLHIEDALGSNMQEGDKKAETISKGLNPNCNEVVQALVSLGYDNSSSIKAVRMVEDETGSLSVEEMLKLALKNIMF